MTFKKGYTPHNKKVKDKAMSAKVIEPEKDIHTVSLEDDYINPVLDTVQMTHFSKDDDVKEPSNFDKLMTDSGQEEFDRIDFTNGKNKLSIVYSKKSNRMFRIQVFLNDALEIRPVTYNGRSPGNAYWQLLKSELNK